MLSFKKFAILLFLAGGVFFLLQNIYAGSPFHPAPTALDPTQGTGVVTSTTDLSLNYQSPCKKVSYTKPSGKKLFVPHNSPAEWTSFITFAQGNVSNLSLNSCGPAPTLDFSVYDASGSDIIDASVDFKGSINLVWNTSNVVDNSCVISSNPYNMNWSATGVAKSGFKTITNLTPQGIHSFSIRCIDDSGLSIPVAGPLTKTVAVAANSPQDITSFTTSAGATAASAIPYNGSATLSWTLTGNPDSCTLSGGSISPSITFSPPYDGSQVVSNLTGNKTYTLTCAKSGFSNDSASVTVYVTAALPLSFTVTPTPANVKSGGSVTFNWNTNYINSFHGLVRDTFSGSWTTADLANGEYLFTDNANYGGFGAWWNADLYSGKAIMSNISDSGKSSVIFTLYIRHPDTGALAQSSATVNVCYTTPAITSFSAASNPIVAGTKATFNWASSGTQNCSISDGSGIAVSNLASSQNNYTWNTALSNTTTFTLTCWDACSSTLQTQIVKVSPSIVSFKCSNADYDSTNNVYSIPYNSTANLTWNVLGAESCVASSVSSVSGWDGATTVSLPTGSSAVYGLKDSPMLYLTCTGNSATVNNYFRLYARSDFYMSLSANPTSFLSTSGGSVDLTRKTRYIWSCNASSVPNNTSWSGVKFMNNYESGNVMESIPILETTTFNLDCDEIWLTKKYDTISNSVTVSVPVSWKKIYNSPYSGKLGQTCISWLTEKQQLGTKRRVYQTNNYSSFEGQCVYVGNTWWGARSETYSDSQAYPTASSGNYETHSWR